LSLQKFNSIVSTVLTQIARVTLIERNHICQNISKYLYELHRTRKLRGTQKQLLQRGTVLCPFMITTRAARWYVFTSVCLCVCVCVCLSTRLWWI